MSIAVHMPTPLKANALNPAAYNPRAISPQKFEALKNSIRTSGVVQSVVVQKKGLKIIGGHQTTKAIMELSIEAGETPPEIPCVVLDIDDKAAKKLNVRLNKIRGEFEARMLGELLVDIYDKPERLTLEESADLGFEQPEALEFFHIIEPRIEDVGGGGAAGGGAGGDGNTFGKSMTLSIEFDSVTTRDRVKKLLAERAKVEKKKTGDVIAGALFPRAKAKKTRVR